MWFSGNINIHKHNDNEAMKHVIINLGELLFADLTEKLGTNKSSKGSVTGKVYVSNTFHTWSKGWKS